jgi:hypothetical protein
LISRLSLRGRLLAFTRVDLVARAD